MDTSEPCHAHEPRHPLPAAGDVMAEGQLGMDPGCSVDASAGLVHLLDPYRQLGVTPGAG